MNFELIKRELASIENDAKFLKNREADLAKENSAMIKNHEKLANDLKNEINQLDQNIKGYKKRINELKKDLSKVIANDYYKDLLDSFASELKEFDIKNNKINKVSAEAIKNELQNIFRDLHEIDEIKKPNLNKRIKDSKIKLDADLEEKRASFLNNSKNIVQKLKTIFNKFKEDEIKNYDNNSQPINNSKIIEEVGIGNIVYNVPVELQQANVISEKTINIPVTANLRENGNVFIETASALSTEPVYENILTALTMNYLQAFPSGSVRLSVFSTNFYSYQKLNALYQAMASNNQVIMDTVSTSGMQLENFLNTILQRGGIVSGKLLSNNCYDLFGLYEKNIKNETFNVVVLQGVLREANDNAIRLLEGLIKGYHTCGIRFIILDSFNEETFKYKSPELKATINRIYDSCLKFKFNNTHACYVDNRCMNMVSVANTLTPQYIYNFVSKYCQFESENTKQVYTYEDIGFGKKYDSVSFEPMEIPVGLVDSNVWNIKFSSLANPLANLIVGTPGTGKSTVIDAMIINGSMKYSPDELVFRYLDFKEGTSSDAYVSVLKIPHMKMVALNNKSEEATIILTSIERENEMRIAEFKRLSAKLGIPIRSILEYNDKIKGTTGFKKMPRMVIIIDECQSLFVDSKLSDICESIIRKGRSQGIHLVLSTQALDNNMKKTVKFVDGRYVFEVAQEDAEVLLPKKYVKMVQTDIPKKSYKAFVSDDLNSQERHKMQTVTDNGKLPSYAKAICQKWPQYPIDRVVVGVKDRLDSSTIDINSLYIQSDTISVPLGENYIDHSVMYMDFNKEKQDAVIMVGTNSAISESIAASTIITAKKHNSDVYVVDASQSQNISNLTAALGFSSDNIFTEDQYLVALDNVQKLYDYRMENFRVDHNPVFFILNAAQNLSQMTNDNKLYNDENNNFEATSIRNLNSRLTSRPQGPTVRVSGKTSLFNLINDAYKVGIYVVMSFDSLAMNSNTGDLAFTHSHNRILKNSNYKILFNDVKTDSSALYDGIIKTNMFKDINENIAFIIDKYDNLCKFRVLQHDLSIKGIMNIKGRL